MCHFAISQPECKQRCHPFIVYEERGNDTLPTNALTQAILFLVTGHSSLNKIQWPPLNRHPNLEIYILTNFYKIINLFI